DLLRPGGAAESVVLHQLLPAVFVAEILLGAGLGQGNQALGHHRAGVDADDAEIVARRPAAHRAGEGHQRGVAGGAGDVVEIGVLAGGAEDVDDDAVAARAHPVVKAAGHVDVAEDLEIPGGAPAVLGDHVEIAAGDRPGVVDEDVGVGALGDQLVDFAAVAEVERENPDADIVLGRDRGASRFEIGGGAGYERDIAPL